MDYYNEYSNIETKNNPSSKFYYLKKLAQILVSVSVFSLFFSHSSFVDQSYDYLVSNLSIKLFTYNSERNYIFLLFNGLLVLIIRASGLTSKITPVQTSSKGVRNVDNRGEKADGIGFQEKHKLEIVEKAEVVEEKGREINGGDDEKEEGEILDYEEVEGKEDYQEWEEEEEGIDDELKKKCDDFIKKMKQEILGV
ncbi:hypothetical protein CDL12_24007 [Handroanthus impetiginosus]|uniref:Transmembrane protein n=1 Tax=Handroanthus impetiginosus TaxID=429701 RepID=A0A2G9GDU5_9LAMI|nr:hypothetical protein CDL12_24007 [Handroanthus impetiginosus]